MAFDYGKKKKEERRNKGDGEKESICTVLYPRTRIVMYEQCKNHKDTIFQTEIEQKCMERTNQIDFALCIEPFKIPYHVFE